MLDFHEVELDLENITHIEDSETGIQIPVHLPSLKKDHAHNIEKFISYWRNLCDKNGIYYHFGHTGQNYAKQIFDFLEKSY